MRSKEKARLLRLRTHLMLDECPYLVTDEIGGPYHDALKLLIESVVNKSLPADVKQKINQFNGAIIGEVEPSNTSVVTADLLAWLASISQKTAAPEAPGLTHKQFLALVLDDDMSRADPAYKAEYGRVSSLRDEQEKLQREERKNFPYIDIEIKKRLSKISYELEPRKVAEAPLSPAAALPVSTPQPVPASELAPAVKSVSKTQLLIAFGDLVTKINLRSAMEDGAKWTVDARPSKGTPGRGGHQAQWDPLIMAIALHERKLATRAALSRAFYNHSFLADWREAWKEQEAQLG